MNQAVRFYRLINILSLDVALGAVCCAAWFAKTFEVLLRPYALFALGITVWIIYTADHLMDALKIKKEASTERHRFHQRYFKILLACLCLVVIVDLSLLFFIRTKIIHAGVILTAIVALYLLINRWLGFLKELIIAMVYCGGVLLPSISLRDSSLDGPEVLLVMTFFLTALINLLLFSSYDIQTDRLDGYNSFVLRFGYTTTKYILVILFIVQMMVLLLLFMARMWNNACLLTAMNVVLFLLFFKPSYFSRNQSYRLYGDAVFIFPAIFLLIG